MKKKKKISNTHNLSPQEYKAMLDNRSRQLNPKDPKFHPPADKKKHSTKKKNG